MIFEYSFNRTCTNVWKSIILLAHAAALFSCMTEKENEDQLPEEIKVKL